MGAQRSARRGQSKVERTMPYRKRNLSGRLVVAVILAALTIQLFNGYFAYRAASEYIDTAEARRASFRIIQTATEFLSEVKDAETGERGYLLTGDSAYLEPYEAAVPQIVPSFERLRAAVGTDHQATLASIEPQLRTLLERMQQTIAARGRPGDGPQTALEILRSGAGKRTMDEIRRAIDDLEASERGRLTDFANRMDRLADSTLKQVLGVSSLAMVLVALAGAWVYRDLAFRTRLTRELGEQRSTLQSVLDGMADGVIVADTQGAIRLTNAAARQIHRRDLTGLDRSEWTPQLRLMRTDRVTPYPTDELPLARTLRGEAVDAAELYVVPVGETEGRFIGVTGRPIFDEERTLRGGVIVVRDITPQKTAQLDMERMNEELDHRVRERTAELNRTNSELLQQTRENEMFVYSVSHDLRSPLVNLQGYSRELEYACEALQKVLSENGVPDGVRERGRTILTDDVASSVKYIQSSVTRLAGIIDALLKLSRAGRVEYQFQQVPLYPVLRRIVDALKRQADEIGGEINIQPLPSVWGDPIAVEQLFANLLENAVKYAAPERPLRVDVGVQPTESSTSQASITLFVRDNGLGIPIGSETKMFKAFERLHPKTSSGEGMGLAIVQRIVDRHGGKIAVESEAGRGTTFFVTFPLGPATDESNG
jgi:signal transduction histidine kinase